MYKALREYISEDDSKGLIKTIRTYYQNIKSDPEFSRFSQFWNQERWEFFDKYFKNYADERISSLVKKLSDAHPQIKKTIHEGQIYEFIKERIFYDLTFQQWQLLVPTNETKQTDQVTITFEPRLISLKTVVSNIEEYNAILNILDEHISKLLNHYQNHRTLALLHAANIEIDKDLNWSFGNVYFISQQSTHYKNCYIKWVKPIYPSGGMPQRFNFGLIKFQGCSALKAMSISLEHFNRAYNCLKMIAELSLNRQVWTTREYLEIPNQSLDIISSQDTLIGSAIQPNLDNDFFSAVKSNSMYKPVVLNKDTVSIIDQFEYKAEVDALLKRSLAENTTQIDQLIFNSLSWFSESQKSFIPVHKYVGFVTAMETLLTGRSLNDGGSTDKGISEMLSERGAILLMDNYQERVQTKKDLKRIYDIRSKIVHGSERHINKPDPYDFMDSKNSSEIFDVQKMAAKIIAKVIFIADKEKINAMTELNEYFQKQILS